MTNALHSAAEDLETETERNLYMTASQGFAVRTDRRKSTITIDFPFRINDGLQKKIEGVLSEMYAKGVKAYAFTTENDTTSVCLYVQANIAVFARIKKFAEVFKAKLERTPVKAGTDDEEDDDDNDD